MGISLFVQGTNCDFVAVVCLGLFVCFLKKCSSFPMPWFPRDMVSIALLESSYFKVSLRKQGFVLFLFFLSRKFVSSFKTSAPMRWNYNLYMPRLLPILSQKLSYCFIKILQIWSIPCSFSFCAAICLALGKEDVLPNSLIFSTCLNQNGCEAHKTSIGGPEDVV